jgi:hypothetical protein
MEHSDAEQHTELEAPTEKGKQYILLYFFISVFLIIYQCNISFPLKHFNIFYLILSYTSISSILLSYF